MVQFKPKGAPKKRRQEVVGGAESVIMRTKFVLDHLLFLFTSVNRAGSLSGTLVALLTLWSLLSRQVEGKLKQLRQIVSFITTKVVPVIIFRFLKINRKALNRLI